MIELKFHQISRDWILPPLDLLSSFLHDVVVWLRSLRTARLLCISISTPATHIHLNLYALLVQLNHVAYIHRIRVIPSRSQSLSGFWNREVRPFPYVGIRFLRLKVIRSPVHYPEVTVFVLAPVPRLSIRDEDWTAGKILRCTRAVPLRFWWNRRRVGVSGVVLWRRKHIDDPSGPEPCLLPVCGVFPCLWELNAPEAYLVVPPPSPVQPDTSAMIDFPKGHLFNLY
ncbi:uncharacterized protein LOC115765153 [Drosophila novamexicana]|uniref:uncharacterized protein LOC115765153 n=1 Tax=Drosophila novamexicana TaxID=47314 RepID=UPI0011E5E841|nr:uncharacterized protein LOC115765153 [Drosophila novamexicana]XP_030564426.1 uncharacterized protein LOC115765153 [Drosophila novamexicana]